MQQVHDQNLTFLLPLASTITDDDLKALEVEHLIRDLDVQVIRENRYNLMNSCEAVVAASGTVTLELALLDVPMVVTYKLAPLTYHLARKLIKLDHFSLVNLIAGNEVVPELLQDEVSADNIAYHLNHLLTDAAAMRQMKNGLALVREKLGGRGASEKGRRVTPRCR